jgi:hypothetical protein
LRLRVGILYLLEAALALGLLGALQLATRWPGVVVRWGWGIHHPYHRRCGRARRVLTRVLGGVGCGIGLMHRPTQLRASAMEVAFNDLTQAAEQVEAVGDLDRLGRPGAHCTRIFWRAVPRDDRESGKVTQPGSDDLGGALGQEIDGAAALQIDKEGAVGATLAQGEVVDPDDAVRRAVLWLGCDRAEQPQEGIPTGRHAQAGGEPGTGLAPGDTPDGAQGLGQA